VVGSCEYGDEPSGSGATELVSSLVSIGQKLMCPIQYKSFLFLFDTPDGTFQSKVGKQW
jgi:hypothetical protein